MVYLLGGQNLLIFLVKLSFVFFSSILFNGANQEPYMRSLLQEDPNFFFIHINIVKEFKQY
jgi:hypothetical protein